MAFSDDLKRLNFKEIHAWPAGFQLATFAIIIALCVLLGWRLLWTGQQEEYDGLVSVETQKRTDWSDKQTKAAILPLLEEQLKEIDNRFQDLLKQLPQKAEMPALITDINQSGVGRGLQFDLFRPGSESKTTERAELPVELEITGQYHDIAAFASDVARLSRIVTLGNIDIKANDKDNKVTFKATAKTYRYLDDAERDQARKEAEALEKAKRDAKK